VVGCAGPLNQVSALGKRVIWEVSHMAESERSEKHEKARDSLPEGLRTVFDDLVADYKFHATKRHGAPYVSYIVLADMVRAGWRLGAEPLCEECGRGGPEEGH